MPEVEYCVPEDCKPILESIKAQNKLLLGDGETPGLAYVVHDLVRKEETQRRHTFQIWITLLGTIAGVALTVGSTIFYFGKFTGQISTRLDIDEKQIEKNTGRIERHLESGVLKGNLERHES